MNKNKKDYSKGKIYCIRSHKTDLIYIGSTCQSLSKRLNKHKTAYNYYLKTGRSTEYSYKIYEVDDAPYIELIVNYPCSCLDELRREEGKFIRSIDCVNKVVPGRTKKEYIEDNKDKIKEYQKEYREQNKEKIIKNTKEYREKNKEKIKKYKEQNKEKIKEYQKEYDKANKDKKKEYDKEYREQNKEKIKEQQNQKFICPCGGNYTQTNKATHEKTNKHKQFINLL